MWILRRCRSLAVTTRLPSSAPGYRWGCRRSCAAAGVADSAGAVSLGLRRPEAGAAATGPPAAVTGATRDTATKAVCTPGRSSLAGARCRCRRSADVGSAEDGTAAHGRPPDLLTRSGVGWVRCEQQDGATCRTAAPGCVKTSIAPIDGRPRLLAPNSNGGRSARCHDLFGTAPSVTRGVPTPWTKTMMGVAASSPWAGALNVVNSVMKTQGPTSRICTSSPDRDWRASFRCTIRRSTARTGRTK
jgi:hypothetical protein